MMGTRTIERKPKSVPTFPPSQARERVSRIVRYALDDTHLPEWQKRIVIGEVADQFLLMLLQAAHGRRMVRGVGNDPTTSGV
jgi:hypothetical protein